eukprot:gene13376-biopygen10689
MDSLVPFVINIMLPEKSQERHSNKFQTSRIPLTNSPLQFTLELLRLQRGIPKEQQIRNLLATYYSLHQNPDESVSNFTHCFMETQHLLQKLVPGIHCSPDGSQVELIHAFSIKLLPDIGKYLITREQPFTNLLAAVECAKRHESMMSSAPMRLPYTDVLYTAPPTAPPIRTPNSDANTQQAEFDFTIEHRPGKANTIPDTLSRAPLAPTHNAPDVPVFTPPEVMAHFHATLGLDLTDQGHPYNCSDLLTLRNIATGQDFPRPVNIEKIVVVPDPESSDLRPPEDATAEPSHPASPQTSTPMPDLALVAYEFGKYLDSLPSKSAISSQACPSVSPT